MFCYKSLSNIMNKNQDIQKKTAYNIKTEVDDFGRKKFTIEQANHKQPDDDLQDKLLAINSRHKSTLQGRHAKLDLQRYIGQVKNTKKSINKDTFYCQICQEGFKCDIAYLTHLNSSSHNRKIGMNMKVQAASKQSVAQKLKKLSEEKLLTSKKKAQVDTIIKKFTENHEGQKQENIKVENIATPKVEDQQSQQQRQRQQLEKAMKQAQQFEIMMKQHGLPSSFGSKKVKR